MTNEMFTPDQHNLLNILVSTNLSRIVETLDEFKVSGTISDLPILIEALHQAKEAEVKSVIILIMSNLKNERSVGCLIEAIGNPRYKSELKTLLTCCWENGLDYSNHLSFFVDLLIKNDFEIAFEAYTVILNLVTGINHSVTDAEIDKLGKAVLVVDEQKKVLLLDVIDFLPSIAV
jgi:hypothetical protein